MLAIAIQSQPSTCLVSSAELFPFAFALAVAMQDLCCDCRAEVAPWGKYDIFISNVLPHRKYDIEYNPCLLPRKQGSVVKYGHLHS